MIGADDGAMIFLLAIQAASGAGFDLARVRPAAAPGCAAGGTSDVVVCGTRPDRYRLPLPRKAAATEGVREASGESAITPAGRCGIFAGERRCEKREARDYGYGGGRDPLTLLVGAVAAVVDPDR